MIDIRFGLGVALFVFALWLKSKRKHRLPLPPGPPGDPIIGHLRYIPENSPADKFAEWSKKYGMLQAPTPVVSATHKPSYSR